MRSDPGYLVIALIVMLTSIIMATLAMPLGRLLTSMPPLRAYAIDIGGSMTGIAVFAVESVCLATPPAVWFASESAPATTPPTDDTRATRHIDEGSFLRRTGLTTSSSSRCRTP